MCTVRESVCVCVCALPNIFNILYKYTVFLSSFYDVFKGKFCNGRSLINFDFLVLYNGRVMQKKFVRVSNGAEEGRGWCGVGGGLIVH